MQFTLQIKPLSVNRAFKGRHFKTPECKKFESDLWRLLPCHTSTGDVEMWLDFTLVNDKRTDISNLVKVMEDILVKKGILEDDRKVIQLHLSKKHGDVDSIAVRIESYTPSKSERCR